MTLFCAAVGVQSPAHSRDKAGAFLQQVLRDNNDQIRPALLLMSQLTLTNFVTVSDKEGPFWPKKGFHSHFLFLVKLVDFKSE